MLVFTWTQSSNIEQVVNDLGGMLDAMKDQQAAVEERVAGLQDAILQLLPEV